VSDARWIEVDSDVDAASEHFRLARQLFDRAEFNEPGLTGYAARMAFMHAVQSGHTSI
jgi:hypothetical protein